jgi:hypothetical protein
LAILIKLTCACPGPRRLLLAGLGLLACAMLLTNISTASAQSKEYQVKAAFLYNFSQFVTWPGGAFGNAQTPFVIGVLGSDPFGSYLDQLVNGQKAGGHSLIVKRISSADEAKSCQIVFISRSEAGQAGTIIAALRGRSVLTVADIDSFAENGGMVGFFVENNRIRFKINLGAARGASLNLSSKLLRLAQVINS